MPRIDVAGVKIDNVTLPEALEAVTGLISRRARGYVVTPNSEFIYACRENPELLRLLNGASLAVADGIGVVYASKILGTPLRERVPGVELGELLLNWASQNRRRVFFLGGKPGVAERAAALMKRRYPGFVLCGYNDGYYKDENEIVEKLSAAAPDIVFVCMGFPRQERFMAANLEKLPPCVMLGLGGSIDVYSGNVRRAPRFFIKFGLEWFYRLLREPKRIGRMMCLPAFLWMVIRERKKKGV